MFHQEVVKTLQEVSIIEQGLSMNDVLFSVRSGLVSSWCAPGGSAAPRPFTEPLSTTSRQIAANRLSTQE